MVEAFTDQKSGNSTPRCSKTASPVFQFVWTTSRRSQVISSYGCTPSVLKTRSIFRPFGLFRPARADPLTVSVMWCSSSPDCDDNVVVRLVPCWFAAGASDAGETQEAWFARGAASPRRPGQIVGQPDLAG